MVGGRVCLQVRHLLQPVEASIRKHCNFIVVQEPAHIATHGPTNAPPARRRTIRRKAAATEKEQRCVLISGIFCFIFSFSWGRERLDIRLRCVRAKSGSAFFSSFYAFFLWRWLGEREREKVYSYNIKRFESDEKEPVSSCAIALSFRYLSQQRDVEEELRKMCGRERWAGVRSCGCVYNMCTLNPISI